MTAIYLYDDACARTFQPFALTRPAGEMRAGALLVRERWQRALGLPVAGHVTAAHLAGFEEPGAAPVLTAGVLKRGTWVVNARYAPGLLPLDGFDALVAGSTLAAIQLSDDVDVALLQDGSATLGSLSHEPRQAVAAETGWWMSEVWDYVAKLVPMLEHDLPILGEGLQQQLPAGAIRVGEHPVYIEDGAVVEPMACFDTTAGPVLIRRGAHVHAFTRLVGPLYVGEDRSVATDRIAASTIGD
jgi:UDP-N-acetylglucosamine diphosphorylase / glucose-1-phosphate thymidylyltransferase / UDP-N-acetylgalactosamine diphosphorylase / glucosamine-1-phosphate N-acetyltransferase / galactosamine-1-phosphate N-acetyltransferase